MTASSATSKQILDDTLNEARRQFGESEAAKLIRTNHTGHHARIVREGRWTAATDFCYWDFPRVELSGFTLSSFSPIAWTPAPARPH